MADEKVTVVISARDQASATIKRLKGEVQTLGGSAGKAAGPLGKLSATTGGMISPLGLAVGGLAAFTGGLAAGAKELMDNERLNAQTAAAIRSTGGAAKVTLPEIEALSEGLEQTTTVERQTVQEGANMLLTFTRVRNEVGKGNDVFDQAAKSALNLSVALGTDMQAASLMVGKALNDPIRGMTAMTKAGIQFTDQQKAMIKAMVEAGDQLGAQKIILAELETQFGGSAEAFAKTTAGKVQRFQNDVGNFFESIVVGIVDTADQFSAAGERIGGAIMDWRLGDRVQQSMTQVNNAVAENLGGTVTIINAAKPAMVTAADAALRDPIVSALLGGQAEAERIAGETPGAIGRALLDNQFSAEDAAAELARVTAESLHPLIERMNIIGFLGSADLAEGLNSNDPTIRQASLDMKEAAESRLSELDGLKWGGNFATDLASGMVNNLGVVRDASRRLGGAMAQHTKVESEPPDHTSPIYGHMKWGANYVQDIAGGILGELGMASGAARALAGAFKPSLRMPALGGVGGIMSNGAAGSMMSNGAMGNMLSNGSVVTINVNAPLGTPAAGQALARYILPELHREQRRQGF